MDEAFCALCGANLADFEGKLVQEYSARLSDIEQMVASQQFWDAVLGLRVLLAAQLHPCLDEIRKRAATLLDQVTAQREELRLRFAGHVKRGRQLLESRRYEEAVQELNLIPAGTRDEEAMNCWPRPMLSAGEISVLKARVRASGGVRFEDRMQSIEKLLRLQPDDPLITRWAVQARDQIVQLAHKRLQQHEYRLAVDMLKTVPEQVVDARVTALLQQASELDFLWSEMELAPTTHREDVADGSEAAQTGPGQPTGPGTIPGNGPAISGGTRIVRRFITRMGVLSRTAVHRTARACI